MSRIAYLPVIKISRQLRQVIDSAAAWEKKGFSNEVSTAAGTLCVYIGRLERRISKLERRNRKLLKETEMASAKKPINMHKQMAMGMNKGGTAKCYSKGGKVHKKGMKSGRKK